MNKKELAAWRKKVRTVVGLEDIDDEKPHEFYADKIVSKKNGTMEIKHGYFYTFGNSAQKWGDKVMASKLSEFCNLVKVENRWAAWPKGSYFVAVIEPKE